MIAIDNRGLTNPYINLALEEYLVRNLNCSATDYLLLYVNTPCVVLGKNQSIYKEVNFGFLRNENSTPARRVSGGGAVYHDEGNLNFSFISSFNNSKVNNYLHFNQRLIHSLNAQGIAAETDQRNNIIVQGKKISGGAQFTNRKNILSHGTLLCNANLSALRQCLNENPFVVETKAPASVKSSVANLEEFNPAFASVEKVKQLVLHAYKVTEWKQLSHSQWQQVEQLAFERYNSFGWIYGRSPHTTIRRQQAIIEINDGLVQHITSAVIPASITKALAGLPYSQPHIKKALDNIPNASGYLAELF